jgi:hypothetical protein
MRLAPLVPVVALGLLPLGAAACVREGAVVVAPVDVAEVGDAGAARPLVVVAAPPSASAREACTARLRAGTIRTGDGCSLDERISKSEGLLVFPCSGPGEIEAVFGEHRFRGSSAGGSAAVRLALTTELDWDDGCHWETQQSIRGELPSRERDGARRPKLVWTYEEHVASGSGCFGSCTARAEIEIDAPTAPTP